MTRLHITVEGQTEERFVNDCIRIHLSDFHVYCDARCILTSKDVKVGREYRGGFRLSHAYETVKRDIQNWLSEDRADDYFFTTMFDYYALPDDFPGVSASKRITDKYEKIHCIEEAIQADIGSRRFFPYIQLHEFEALVFANPEYLDWEYLEHDEAISSLVALSKSFVNPELINDSPLTAPSKRIIAAIPEHEHNKTSGAIVASKIGIPSLKEKCPHFRGWIEKLEQLGDL